MVGATVAAVAFVLGPRLAPGALVFDHRPDAPRAFGAGMAWLAVRTRDSTELMTALRLADVEAANWDTGLGTVYDTELGHGRVFLTPPVNGWSFAVGTALPMALGAGYSDRVTPLLLDLGRRFIEVQYFATFPDIDHFAWARMIDGKLVRAFAVGDEGILLAKGKPTREEKALGLKLVEQRSSRGRKGDEGSGELDYPTEGHVMHLAARWSLDPTTLTSDVGPAALGWIGRAPANWRPERLWKTA